MCCTLLSGTFSIPLHNGIACSKFVRQKHEIRRRNQTDNNDEFVDLTQNRSPKLLRRRSLPLKAPLPFIRLFQQMHIHRKMRYGLPRKPGNGGSGAYNVHKYWTSHYCTYINLSLLSMTAKQTANPLCTLQQNASLLQFHFQCPLQKANGNDGQAQRSPKCLPRQSLAVANHQQPRCR